MSTAIAPLAAGQRMGRAEFPERCKDAPPGPKFELVGGGVVMAGPRKMSHGRNQARVKVWLGIYESRTPGTEAYDNTSAAPDDLSEVQPDAALWIVPGRGGQLRDQGGIIAGAPELVVEVADSSRRVDLGAELRLYEAAAVQEYVVLTVEPFEVIWHARCDGRLARVGLAADGLHRSAASPGLWLDPAAPAAGDGPAPLAAPGRGLGSPEHAAVAADLQARAGR